ncbi:hypothetical protein SAMN05660916_03013 [Arthrobacter sp. 31Cvi3.1E]|nr:hypothetical protein SAMN05660916_03013 [Arthrobacter sp. 31Cvi3.1E]
MIANLVVTIATAPVAPSTNWGTVIVAVVGFVGIIITQRLTSRREKAQQAHQVAEALRERRVKAYSELIESTNNLMLLIPEVLTVGSGAGSLNAAERGPMNAASSKAHLLASGAVQEAISGLVDTVYAYAEELSEDNWAAFDEAMDRFVDAAQSESDHGNVLGLTVPSKGKQAMQTGG